MYKNPELSAQAKLLRQELARHGLSLTHVQSLEVLSRLAGSRSLHVEQAKAFKARPSERALAQAHADRLFFVDLGRYRGQSRKLFEELRAAFELTDSRSIEAAVHAIFGAAGAPVVQPHIERVYRHDEYAQVYDRMEAESLELVLQLRAQPVGVEEDLLYQGPMLDWQVQEGTALSDLPAHAQQAFNVCVKRSGHQFYVDIAPRHSSPEEIDDADQLSLFIEVNEGVPCVHLTNQLYGDQVLTVFSTAQGLFLRADSQDLRFSRRGPEQGSLKEIQASHSDCECSTAVIVTPKL